MMDQILFDQSEIHTRGTPPARPVRKFIFRALFIICLLAAFSLLVLEATEPLGEPGACISCHEMQAVHDRWSKSSHYANPSGVKVTCIACHLPPREDHFAHLAGKTTKGASHAWTHYFGEFDEKASRQLVLDTLPNARCLHCHNNLAAKPSTPAVGAVHAWSLEESVEIRVLACVACHDHLHTPIKVPEKKYYDEADNSFCFVCHINFKKEPLVVRHQAANVGCVDCHAESREHADDEDNATAPDIMYTKSEVNDACSTGCHEEEDIKKNRYHKAWFLEAEAAAQARAAALATSRPFQDTRKRKHCTDCHGMHKLDERDRMWDKKTKKLIWREGHPVDPNAEPETKPAEERM
ncbi:MAG: NapC/NirT family cytochrome c [Phycisphaerae bacterium]|jgi:nitrate/TMAO reductase-like tetraheme cytochrome c subunit|nr:NapC/NirT family cytochrome c [Phycisphaerae bacterium]